jgi:hypothetical protein
MSDTFTEHVATLIAEVSRTKAAVERWTHEEAAVTHSLAETTQHRVNAETAHNAAKAALHAATDKIPAETPPVPAPAKEAPTGSDLPLVWVEPKADDATAKHRTASHPARNVKR